MTTNNLTKKTTTKIFFNNDNKMNKRTKHFVEKNTLAKNALKI